MGFDVQGNPVTAGQLRAAGAMLALLHEALRPNLVCTAEGTPAFVHGGPFANIAHGCNSLLATRMAMQHADWTITEAGFGFDLGAEKFFDILCVGAQLDPACVVLVATLRALRMHGGAGPKDFGRVDAAAVERGLTNLEKHVESITCFGAIPIVALNRFDGDTEEELAVVRSACARLGVPFAVSDHFARGGAGAVDLAHAVLDHTEKTSSRFRPLYTASDDIPAKILAVAQKMYGARSVVFTKAAERDLAQVRRLGFQELPVCIAKTQNSLSDDPQLRGRPQAFDVHVRGIQINAGAGFLVVLTGDILRMPGLPRRPLAESLDVRDGKIVGLS